MKISAISDVHIKKPFDEQYHILVSFLENDFVKSSDYIVFLGDIFDLMCGPHQTYINLYEDLFQKIKSFLENGKKVYFFEGNHDVHLDKLFKKIFSHRNYYLTQEPHQETIEGKRYLFSHGDEYDLKNTSYHNYKKLILSPPLKLVANYFMPYGVLTFFGEQASLLSRKKGRRYFDEDLVRDKFRMGVEGLRVNQNLDFILGGHSHVKDLYTLSDRKSVYINNGYAPKEKTFIGIENHQVRFVNL